jgi:hypothetical protein
VADCIGEIIWKIGDPSGIRKDGKQRERRRGFALFDGEAVG